MSRRPCRRYVSASGGGKPQYFLRRHGRPRTAGEVYGKLTGRFELARASSFAPETRVALNADTRALSPDTAGVTQLSRRPIPICRFARQQTVISEHVH